MAALAALYFLARARLNPSWPSDFDQVWTASRALVHGTSPYTAVGPHGTMLVWPVPLYYPLTAALIAMPFAALSLPAARVAFVAVGAGWLAYAMTRRDYTRLPLFAGSAFLTAAATAQWSPLLAAAALTPGAALLYLAKPNEGLAMAAALIPRDRRVMTGIAIAAMLFAVSLACWPFWPLEWHAALAASAHFDAPVVRPGGFLILAVLVRWRRPDARMVAVLACVPQTMLLYSAVALFLIPATFAEALVLAFGSWLAFAAQMAPADSFIAITRHTGTAMVWCLYLPCVVMVLRRPNVAAPL